MPKRWSTKTPTIICQPTADSFGKASFAFTDDYSVFHYSKMPDLIPDKGEALARIASHTFQVLDRIGVPNHFIEFQPPRAIIVRFARILDPDRGELTKQDRCRLVPLQVIYRHSIPANASIRRRADAGQIDLETLGLEFLPPSDVVLPEPILEYTTKLEEIDRFLPRDDAQALACLSDEQMLQIETLARQIARMVGDMASACGLICADGKIEFAIDERGDVVLVDTAGTPDENRFLLNQVDVSKQVLRDYYLSRGLETKVQCWARDGVSRDNWPIPERLPPELIDLMAEMYRSLCEHWTGTEVWGAAPLEDVARRIKDWQADGSEKTSVSFGH